MSPVNYLDYFFSFNTPILIHFWHSTTHSPLLINGIKQFVHIFLLLILHWDQLRDAIREYWFILQQESKYKKLHFEFSEKKLFSNFEVPTELSAFNSQYLKPI